MVIVTFLLRHRSIFLTLYKLVETIFLYLVAFLLHFHKGFDNRTQTISDGYTTFKAVVHEAVYGN